MLRRLIVAIFTLPIITTCALSQGMSTLEYIDSISPPKHMQGVGNSQMPISTQSDEAQTYFDQGLSLLHDFWYFEAYRAFKHASQLDPEAAMPHWGMYLAAARMPNLSDEEREWVLKQSIKIIRQLKHSMSEREQYYLSAVIARHETEGDEGMAEHNRLLLSLLNKYPDEIEARLFLWGGLQRGFEANGDPKRDQLFGQLLLEREFERHGNHHGLLHYWIHNQEPGQHPESALDAAKKLARLAPNSGHIVHMPGHIYYLTGDYAAAHEQFKKAEKVDASYLEQNDIDPVFTWNYLHNYSFMMSNLAEAGRFADGSQYEEKLSELTENSAFRHNRGFEMLLSKAIMERAFMAIRLERFAEAAALINNERWRDWEKSEKLQAIQQAYHAYAAGMAAVSDGKTKLAQKHSSALDSVLWRAARDDISLSYRQQPLEISALELQGRVAALQGNLDEGVSLLQRALTLESELRYGEPRSNVHPVAESLATVLQQKGAYSAAIEAYHKVLKQRPNAGMPLYGIAVTHELAGDTQSAKEAYQTFLKAWSDADPTLPQVINAQAWLKEN